LVPEAKLDKAALQEYYKYKADDELLELFQLEDQPELALEALKEELLKRGIEDPEEFISQKAIVEEQAREREKYTSWWSLGLTSFVISSVAVLSILFDPTTFGAGDDATTRLFIFFIAQLIFYGAVSNVINDMAEKAQLKKAFLVSLLSMVSGIAIGVFIFNVALFIDGNDLWGGNYGFSGRLAWTNAILFSAGGAYIAPTYIMASRAKKMYEGLK